MLSAVTAQATSNVTLSWVANTEPDIAGYRLHYGTTAGSYDHHLEAGNATTAVLSDLADGTTYFIALTAYNAAGIESQPSNEISYTASGADPSPTPTPDPSATPTPDPSATPTPGPSATPTPEPSATPTPEPSATPTPGPSATPTPEPSATPTPEPSVTPTPEPSVTPIPSPTPTPLPTATPSPTASPAVTPTPLPALTFGSTQGIITPPFARNTDNTISQGIESVNPINGGRAVYPFTITHPGPYTVSINVKAPSDSANSVFASIDGEPVAPTMIWDTPVTAGFQSKTITWRGTGGVSPKVWSLNSGIHQLVLRGREANLKLGQISISQSVNASSPTPPPARQSLLNVTTRAFVQNGDNVMIGGFIILGSKSKKVIIRALGPSLAKAGVIGAMVDPILKLHDSKGTLIAWNDNWTTRRNEVAATGIPPSDGRESAIVATLKPGNYTAIVESKTGAPGVALFELYDLDAASSHLVNISTRGKVGTGDNVVIGGFIIGGDQPTKVLIRAIGPSLTKSGVANALQDPRLELHGSTGSLIFANDNWRTAQQQQIKAAGIPPKDDKEAAIIATLKPGSYTAIVRGGGNATGVALVEVYNLNN